MRPVTITAWLAGQRVRAIKALNVRRIRLLHLADGAVIYLALVGLTAIVVLGRSGFDAWANMDRYSWSYALIALLHMAVFYFGGLYERERRIGRRPGLPRIVMLTWIASLLTGLVSWMLGEFLIPRSILIVFALVAPLLLVMTRWLSRWLRTRAEGHPRLLLVGNPASVKRAEDHFYDAEEAIIVAGDITTVDQLEKSVDHARATDVLLLESGFLSDLYTRSLARLEAAGVGVLQVVSAQDSLLGLRNVTEVGGIPFVCLSSHVLPASQARLKRYLDLSVLIVTLPITLPLMAFLTIYVGITVGRPLLFVQRRVGRDGELFPMMKFRSMQVNAESGTGPVQAAKSDPRVVPGMGWMRQTRLDELPQLWNVFRGQMSIVGPRPERPEETAQYDAVIPGYWRRHQVPPGITGLAQVRGYARTDPEYKLGHDLHYLANWSPVLDLQVMARTAWVIVSRRG